MSSGPGQLELRDATAAEQAAIQELTLVAYAEYATIMAPRAWAGLHQAALAALNSSVPAERIVAVQHERLVGSVLLYPSAANAYDSTLANASWPELRLLAVLPTARGQGVGRALMQECARRARRSGADALGLHTSQSMQAAIRMYERMGFVRAPEHDFQPDGAEVVIAYRLSLTTESTSLG